METIMRNLILACLALVFGLALQATNVAQAADMCDIQEALQQQDYYHGPIDCDAGPMTYWAIRQFQRDHGLYADGIVGYNTSRRLFGRQW
jgi:peptidoglycan hydrolase-like protein with peptidoglycan-binding domain